jgi:hypothetical protein
MRCSKISFSGHAIRRMFQRSIDRQAVVTAIESGEIIAGYPDDQPHPSFLLLDFAKNRPIHVVLAQNQQDNACVVITATIPDLALWSDGFKKRRK